MSFLWLFLLFLRDISARASVSNWQSTTPNLYQNGSCRYLPGDLGWPSKDAWAVLNSTVGGRLIQTVPLASVCHDPSYNQEKCDGLREAWDTPIPQYVKQQRT